MAPRRVAREAPREMCRWKQGPQLVARLGASAFEVATPSAAGQAVRLSSPWARARLEPAVTCLLPPVALPPGLAVLCRSRRALAGPERVAKSWYRVAARPRVLVAP